MDRENFELLVQQLETTAKQNPRAYNARVAALAVLGYVYVFCVLAVCLLLLAGLAWIMIYGHHIYGALLKIGFFIGVFTLVIIKSLFVKIEAPEGRELKPEEAPQLFADLKDIRDRLACPKPHHVLLTDDFNAAVAQAPRLGILGWQRNYLIVGLPLMASLTPAEFKSVLAHEFGHLSGNHSRFGGWIYRVQATWWRIMESLGGESSGDLVFGRFFSWYAPFFGAYSFALRRANEYEADRCAAEICGAEAAGSALTRGAVAGGFLSDKYWPELLKRVGREATPPTDTFAGMRSALVSGVEPARASMWLAEAVHRPADTFDSHPSLTQRLEALGQKPNWEPLTGTSAAEFYLGERLNELTAQMDAHWSQTVSTGWQKRHQELAAARERLVVIEAKASDVPLTDEEQWDRADATEDFGDEDRALELFQEYLATHPEEGKAHFAVGRILLKRGDDSGLSYLERAMELEEQAAGAVCELSESFLLQRGRTEEAVRFRTRGRQHADKMEAAQMERSGIFASDTFIPHDLDADTVESLRSQFALHENVAKVFVARKQLQHFPHMPMYVLGVAMVVKKFSIGNEEEKRANEFRHIIQSLTFEKQCFFVQLDATGGHNFEAKFSLAGSSAVIYEKPH